MLKVRLPNTPYCRPLLTLPYFKADREVLRKHSSVTLRLFIAFPDDHVCNHSRVHSVVRSRVVHFGCDLFIRIC